jgi:hypothetical protein
VALDGSVQRRARDGQAAVQMVVTSSRAPDRQAAVLTVQARTLVQPLGNLTLVGSPPGMAGIIPNNKLAELGERPLMLARCRLECLPDVVVIDVDGDLAAWFGRHAGKAGPAGNAGATHSRTASGCANGGSAPRY